MSNEIVTVSDMQTMAQAVVASGLFGIKTKEQALTLMLISQAEGRHPALAARDYDIIQNKPSKKAEAMLRDFLQSGGKVKWHDLTDILADATFSHPSGGEIRITWDMKRAAAAGLGGKDMWKKYPRQMLRARVVSEGIRTVCPMATSGMYVPEEVQDFDDKPRAPPIQSTVIEPPKLFEPPSHPETGEVSPHQIPVPMLADNSGTDWMEWGKAYAAALQSAANIKEFNAWISQNAGAMGQSKDGAPKIHARLSAIIDANRLAHSLKASAKDELDVALIIPPFLKRELPEAAE